MKNSLTLILAIIIFAVLGCNLSGSADKDNNPTIETPNPSSDSTTEKPDSKSGADDPKTSSSSPSDLTMEKFNRLENGMSYEDVVKILGAEGDQTSETKTSSSYKWKGEKFAAVYVTFRNGILSSKRQYKISNGDESKIAAADVSKDKFENIKIGMSYAEIVKIIGSEGIESSSTTIGNTEIKSYKWAGEKFSAIYGTFRNGELSSKRQTGLK